jgi:hypothetical protein
VFPSPANLAAGIGLGRARSLSRGPVPAASTSDSPSFCVRRSSTVPSGPIALRTALTEPFDEVFLTNRVHPFKSDVAYDALASAPIGSRVTPADASYKHLYTEEA